MGPILLDLRPNIGLLNSNFDGYKLSLEQIPQVQKELENKVDKILLDSDHSSLLHTKLFGLHNHLIGENLNGIDSLYFVDKDLNLLKTYQDSFTNEFVEPIQVFQIPKLRERVSGDYNITFKFLSEELAVLSDGVGLLYVLNTGDRDNDDMFTIIYEDYVLNENKGFIIQDSLLYDNEIHVLLHRIQQSSENKHINVINWITLKSLEEKWCQSILRELQVKGDTQYLYLEKNCNALYVVSENGCKFSINSENPVITNHSYTWIQHEEAIKIKFILNEKIDKELIKITTNNTKEITIKNNEMIFHGKLKEEINTENITSKIDNKLLEITLNKLNPGIHWDFLIENDDNGCYITSMEEFNEFRDTKNASNESAPFGTTFSSQMVEECDMEYDKTLMFERICCKTNKTTHKINLGSNRVLITANLEPNQPPAMGIRHDVDVLLWQPQFLNEDFIVKHEATLNAFGYVQASKQNRKFSICTPDLNYSIICESTRHLFIYQQEKSITSGELRNRGSGRRFNNISQQKVVSIANINVLGIYASNNVLFLLGEDIILGYKLQ